LNLSWNGLSLAAEGLSSLFEWMHSSPLMLQHLDLSRCQINDQGLQSFTQGPAIHCRELILTLTSENRSITATGLSCLSNSLQFKSCRVEILDLYDIPSAIGEDGAKALALGLSHSTSLKSLSVGSSFNNAHLRHSGFPSPTHYVILPVSTAPTILITLSTQSFVAEVMQTFHVLKMLTSTSD